MPDYSVELIGSHREAPGLPATVAYHLIKALYQSAKGAVRLEVEGRSAARGTQPNWLGRVADFSVDIADEFPGLRVRAPTLGDASPDRFGQGVLFGESIGEMSALSFLFRGLTDALEGRTDSEAYDPSLLRMFGEFGYVLGSGVTAINIRNGREGGPVVRIDASGLNRAENLQERTPAPKQVRIAGTLDQIRYSNSAFTLLLHDEERTSIRGYLSESLQPDVLVPHWGKEVAMSAVVHFRPSGAPLRIEAQHVRPASSSDLAVFSEVPQPIESRLDLKSLTRPQGPSSGMNAIFGRWPGNETAEEIIEALEKA